MNYTLTLRTEIDYEFALILSDRCKRSQFESKVGTWLLRTSRKQIDRQIANAIKARYMLGVAFLMEELEKYEDMK